MAIIGIDIGGTKIESAVVENGRIIENISSPTPVDGTKKEVFHAICGLIDKIHSPAVMGIGIGVPGLVDLETNEVIDMANIPSWDRVPLKKWMEDRYHVPVIINNDANCFAIGEKHFGKGRQYHNFAGIVLGTGLGAGIIINDHLYSGMFCGAGEFGPVSYLDKTIEAYASGQFFRDRGFDGNMLAMLAEKGDPGALKQFDELGQHIGQALSAVLFTMAPEAIILGGSVSRSFEYFEKGMKLSMERSFPYRRLLEKVRIEISDLKNSGVLGACSLVLDAMEG
jgi:glucokinase